MVVGKCALNRGLELGKARETGARVGGSDGGANWRIRRTYNV